MALRGAASRRYAESIFAIAKDQNSFDRWLEDVATIRGLFTNADMRRFLDDPKPTPAAKEETLHKLLDGKVDPMAVNLAILLVRREHVGIAEYLEREFQRMVNEERNVAVAEVTTAVELAPRDRDLVKQRLEVLAAKTIQLDTRVDKDILGGFVARVGDTLIDASLKTRLANLRQELLAHT
jgi:F-type H+-transporting ATPase subunit delta